MAISAAIIGALGAASRGWILDHVDTFDTNPSGKYSTRSGSPSVSWDSTNQRLAVSGSTPQNFVAYDAWGGLSGKFAIEMDVVFASDSEGRRHWGFFCDSGASGCNGYRFATLDGAGWSMSRWVGSSETSLGQFSSSGGPTVGNTYTIRVERDDAGNFSMYVEGVKQPNTINDTVYGTIRPGFFVYGAGIQVNELRVYK